LSNKIDERVSQYHQQAVKHLENDQPDQAIELFKKALKISPHNASLMCNLGYALLKQGKAEEALTWFDFAIAAKPGWHIAFYNRGLALHSLRRFDEAKAAFEEGAALQPDHLLGKINLATIHMENAQWNEALQLLDEVLAIEPKNQKALLAKGGVYNMMKKPLLALEALNNVEEAEVTDDPTYYIEMAQACSDLNQGFRIYPLVKQAFEVGNLTKTNKIALAQLLMGIRKSDQCIRLCDEILAEDPLNYEVYRIKGSAMSGPGRSEDAFQELYKCYEKAPEYLSNYLPLIFAINYVYPPRNKTMQRVTRDYDKYIRQSLAMVSRYDYPGSREPGKKLRIGFVSPDLREHSCGYFIEALFAGLNREQFEVVAIPTKVGKDSRATLLRRLADEWVPVVEGVWEEKIEALRGLELDIAFDLAGHTSHHSIPAFVARVAPVQVNWLGYPNTTGIRNMDYRIIDNITDPVDADRSIYTEDLVRLDRCFLCYSPPDDYPEVEDKTGREGIVFGSFNAISKVNADVMQLWAQVLKSVPDSTIVIKALQLGEESLIDRAREQLVAHGVDPDRLRIFAAMPSTFDHLNLYNEVDIALDPFPYNGTTTSCEAMLMGVPVVTMVGDLHSARVGASLMNAVGMTDLVAKTPEEYMSLASELALDLPRLRNLQAGLRERMLSSPLMDRADFSDHFGRGIREMWRAYCESGEVRADVRHGNEAA
tara:strand:+ start:2626 stop:4755 length:2130 start_codon:yes stop_codon:yes gene_type:complete